MSLSFVEKEEEKDIELGAVVSAGICAAASAFESSNDDIGRSSDGARRSIVSPPPSLAYNEEIEQHASVSSSPGFAHPPAALQCQTTRTATTTGCVVLLGRGLWGP